MAAHARLGPSDSSRWLNCAGSINFTKDYPNKASEHAAQGTVAHWVREQCLEFGFEPYHFIGTKMRSDGFLFEVDGEMAEHLQYGIDEIREFEGKLFVETRISLDRWMPGQFGTLDAGIVGQKLIVLSDLKFGEGVAVQAVDNTQQMIYALGFWEQIARHISSATEFLIIIDQPRNAEGGGVWPVTLETLLAFGETVRAKAAATFDPNAPLTPSKKACAWCPAANIEGRIGGCPAHHQMMAEAIDLKFSELDIADELGIEWKPPQVGFMTPERKAHLARVKTTIVNWLEYIHADVLQERIDQGPAFGVKAVHGRRPARKWIAPEPAEAFLTEVLPADQVFTKKMISPSQAESIFGKGRPIPRALVDQGNPKPILVPVEDKRPALQTLDDRFDDVE